MNKNLNEGQTLDGTQVDHLIVEENVPEFLQRVAQKFEQDGEVLVQTEANVGTEGAVGTEKTIH